MLKIPLTPNQQRVLAFVAECQRERGSSPTRAEISARFDWRSANAAEDVLRGLARKGYITLRSGTARGIVIRQSADEQAPAVDPCQELRAEIDRLKAERDEWAAKYIAMRRKYSELRWPGLTGVVRAAKTEPA